ncbi:MULTISPECIES: flagellin [unclassified Colwellia]|jgi:flagellin|uniref:flagellin N-terminal helical domain-containing protein n=1 Tax=unclassified Colwellia TaxID=196834 RepID=UPI0015F44786|nr:MULTISPECIES: flagellin [unclassified Colwellia]MBA6253861.1 flagellin FliC [Colwellia sp. MB3u-55]MBA6396428.1 flagellin FliC [Colwellia sp. BRX10-4]
MALSVNSNIASLNSQRQLSKATNDLGTSYERLSSGKRINSAKDDAAGLQISSRLTAQVNGLNQGSRNANDGISLAQTAEGALDEVTNTLQRMRTLAVQSSNGSNSTADRTALNNEYTELENEIVRIASQTSFGGVALLDGTYSAEFQVGADANQVISVSMDTDFSGLTTGGIDSAVNAQAAITLMDTALATTTSSRADLGAKQNRFSSAIRSNDNTAQNVAASRSRIEDTDYAAESAILAKNSVLQQASSSMLAQANQQPQIALSLL